jgi:hypothetical protein
MSRKSGLARATWTSGAVLLALSGCSKFGGGDDSTAWARGALERNPNLEVVAHDADTGAFTVRDKASGELIVLRADQIIGTVPSTIAAATRPAAQAPATVPAEAEPAAPATNEPAAEPSGTMARSGEAARAEDVDEPTGPGPQPSSAAFEAATANQPVLASGPGYSIKRGAGANAPAAAAASPNAPAARNVRLEQRYDPIICQGQRMLQIDNQNLAFEGDAITAEAGCEIHITNSHITAGGIGVSARGARVHIKNSSIEGDSGSVSASDGAQVYAQSSTFKGLSRRLDTAALHDLGGNVWN